MITIIAGSRDIADYKLVEKAVKASGFHITEVLSGGARGVDQLGIWYAKDHGIPFRTFEPDWRPNGKYDPTAGFKRNYEMALNADALIAIWDGESRDTLDMINKADQQGLQVFMMKEI